MFYKGNHTAWGFWHLTPFIKHRDYQTSLMGQVVDIASFEGYVVAFASIQLHHQQSVNRCGWICLARQIVYCPLIKHKAVVVHPHLTQRKFIPLIAE